MRIGITPEEQKQGLAKLCPSYCPKCGGSALDLNKYERNFDEEGWYYPVEITCKTKTCNHKYVYRLPVATVNRTSTKRDSLDPGIDW